ncbi:Nucleoid-associated protein Lsr2 (plasmid) [Variovorax sp. PBS-H4]|uniref:histone-like nucleoid-structuring protein Lsr2 n=1 Tax=Variovorax sp. PBS-H4 TaxID=434008 RepID=UPI001316D95D|nr:Lsr2 family protein [Variovorax sp. PBS-H4]VTU41418.1 Nucleoid-associated protein Lsr2 [Variovorax sp. PBS-H4]
MATHTSVQLIDDLDGKSEAAETVQFALDGAAFEIDLTESNAAKLRKALDRYVAAGRRIRATSPSTRRPATRSEGRSREELAQIRAWAVEAGYEIADRGRIAKNILEAYDAR